MYSENEKQSRRRSGDEFLRRMRGEEFLSVMSMGGNTNPRFSNDVPNLDTPTRTRCDGSRSTTDTPRESGSNCSLREGSCANMPSLAMVYSPVQAFHKLLSPVDGLSNGSIFEELILPFEAGNHSHCGTGGCNK